MQGVLMMDMIMFSGLVLIYLITLSGKTNRSTLHSILPHT